MVMFMTPTLSIFKASIFFQKIWNSAFALQSRKKQNNNGMKFEFQVYVQFFNF